MNRILSFKIIAAFLVIIFFSCSKDSDEPTPQETQITVSTANFSKTIDENPTNGQVIGTVLGNTNQGTVTFSITEHTPSGALSIDATTGELKVADETLFDFETNPTITGTVKVANGAVSQNAVVIISLNDLVEENVFDGDVILRSQQEVNAFGANNYTQINGFLIIGKLENEGYSDITDLAPLSSIKNITSTFLINNNGVLATTEGLNPYSITYLQIANNPSLESVTGFRNITYLKNLSILNNNVLTDLSGLSQVIEIEQTLRLGWCPEITNLDWANNIISLGAIGINNCHALTNIDGLSNLTNINLGYNHISISENNSLQNLNGLQNLVGTLAFLQISGNPSLENINGLTNINFLMRIEIVGNSSLQNLDGLMGVTSLYEGIAIRGNTTLRDIEGLQNLVNTSGMSITNNQDLTSLNGLEGLINIASIGINNNSSLTDFCSLKDLFTIDPNIYYSSYNNAYNPTKQDIIDGNCSL